MSEETVVPDLYRLAFVPGVFRCPQCGFVLSRTSMNFATGQFGTTEKDRESEPCPNDGTMMVHVSWQEQAETLSNRLTDELDTHRLPDDVSLQEVARRVHAQQVQIEPVLTWMKQTGSSVLLNWGEDDGLWECSWITGGKRHTGLRIELRDAILESLNKCFASMVNS